MKVISIIPEVKEKDKVKTPKQYIVQATEKELDKVSGIAEVAHIAGRIQVGHEIKIAKIYDNLDRFAKNEKKLSTAVDTLRRMANSIKNILPKE